MEGKAFTIVGIEPPAFTGLLLTMQPDVVVPLTAFPLLNGSASSTLARPRGSFWVRTTGRLKPGVSLAQARTTLETMWSSLKESSVPAEFASGQRQRFLATRLLVQSAATGVEQPLRQRFTAPLMIVFGIALLIVALACVNLASLMLARTAARTHEMGVRLALGAGRWRLAQQLLTEGILLALAGALCGTLFATWCSRVIVRLIFQDYIVPASLDTALDPRVIAFVAALTALVGLLFSLAPAWKAANGRTFDAFRQSDRTVSSTGRTGRGLVVVQVALSLVLVMNAGLLVRSLQQVRAVPSGMRPQGVTVIYTSPRTGASPVDHDSYYPELVARVQGLPGVQSVGVSLSKPAGGGVGGGEWVSRASAPIAFDEGVAATFGAVSPGFFETLGMALRSGRDFSWRDHSRATGVAILSETLARRLFPSGDPLGQRVRIGVAPHRQSLEVIGVVADARLYDLKDPNMSGAYVAALQQPDPDAKCLVVRGAGVSHDALNTAVDALGHERITGTQTLTYITDRVLLQERLTAALAGFFGALALLLAAIGLYGLMSYAVSHRSREIGIRLALGATPARVTREVMRDGLGIALVGVGVGFPVALAAVQLVKSLLFGITPYDPVTSLMAPLLLLVVAALSSLFPARRAARVDPIVALRAE